MSQVRESKALHPQLEEVRRQRIASGARPLHELSVAEARLAESVPVAEPEPVHNVTEHSFAGPGGALRIRLYRPGPGASDPLLVFFFGGGWATGSIDASDPICRRLALATPCAVAAVDYRLAPEHPFPAAVEDCYAAARWLEAQADELGLDPRGIAVGGGSAGANLAAAVARLALERGGPSFVFQLLVYPPTDARANTPSLREHGDPFFLDREAVAWCWSHYLTRDGDRDDPLASPLRADDVRGLPPALVITAELDPLRDEGELYAAKLAAGGVPTELVRFDGMVHGFFSMTDAVDAAAEAQALAAAALRQAFR